MKKLTAKSQATQFQDATVEPGLRILNSQHYADNPLLPKDKRGLTLYCLERMMVVDPDGNEIHSPDWHNPQVEFSAPKKIVIELVCAKIKREAVSREKLLSVLFPNVWTKAVTENHLGELHRTLTMKLTQLEETFSPYKIIEETRDGYRLHPTVYVSLFEKKTTTRKK